MPRHAQKGYSLIELLAAAAIFSGMMIITVATFSLATSSQSATSSRRLVHQSARTAVESMIREVAASQNVYDSATSKIMEGGGGFFLAYKTGSSTQINKDARKCFRWVKTPCQGAAETIASDTTSVDQAGASVVSGNVLIIYSGPESSRIAKIYYPYKHPERTGYALYSQTITLDNTNKFFDLNGINNLLNRTITISPTQPGNQVTGNDVIIEDPDKDFKVYGLFPEAGLTRQPYLTISLTVRNRQANTPQEMYFSTYQATITHRDYGHTRIP